MGEWQDFRNDSCAENVIRNLGHPKTFEVGGQGYMEEFSLNSTVLRDIFHHAKPLGHHQEASKLNLGFGFIYYGVVRALRPKHTLVIGSGYGFSVVCLGLGIRDNGFGSLTFVDPSYSLLKDARSRPLGVEEIGMILKAYKVIFKDLMSIK
jgi:hypothetical protein